MSLSVVLTGEFGQDRDDLVAQLSSAGLKYTTDLSKKAVLCVGANAKTMKQQEARLMGMPIVKDSFLTELISKSNAGEQPVVEELIRAHALALDAQNDNSEVSDLANRKKRKATILLTETKPWITEKRRKSLDAVPGKQQPRSIKPTVVKKQSYVIALEGLIGAGKSTLCGKLIDAFPDDCDVYKEQTNEKFLQLFYSDPKRYGFALQWGMLKSRIFQLRLAQHDTKYGRVPHCSYFYWDRSMIGDYTFALLNHLTGGISKQEMDVYESEFGGSIRNLSGVSFMEDINLFVMMDDEPARCKSRVETVRGNASEQGIPLAYYQGLDDIHFHLFMTMMKKKISKAIVLSWGQYNDANVCQKLFQDVIAGTRTPPQVADVDSSEVVDPSPSTYTYETAAEIIEFYNFMSANNEEIIAERLNYDTVFIPSNVLIVEPAAAGVVAENDYNITFYTNEYKRVVMWHLSQYHNVYFYKK